MPMQLTRSFTDLEIRGPVWMTVGTFDGIHLGHQAILKRLVERARSSSGGAVLVTFEPHPQSVIRPASQTVQVLTPTEEKIGLLEPLGLDALVVLVFTTAIAGIGAEAFIGELAEKFSLKGMVSGASHRFGAGRGGNASILEKLGGRFGFEVDVVPSVSVDGESVSSTRIRELLSEGDVEKAGRFLGRIYEIAGAVVRGRGVGRKLGFPTANLEVSGEGKQVPKDGVYAVRVKLDSVAVSGTANIGCKPTFGAGDRTLEVHLIGYDGDLAGRRLEVGFLRRLRDERRFESAHDLTEQIRKDIEKTIHIDPRFTGG
jgi:riboflavin kinase / FMN adenylyltransferase